MKSANAAEPDAGDVIVVACVHRHTVSQTGAALLRSAGHAAYVLEGGVEGWVQAGLPTLAYEAGDAAAAEGALRQWVIGSPVTLRALCTARLVQRDIDADATFLFVEHEFAETIADEIGAHAIVSDTAPEDATAVLKSLPAAYCIEDAVLGAATAKCIG